MSSNATLIKQLVAGRRKPDMTRKEYFDHHFQVHGAISDRLEDVDMKPHKYIQVHVFDSAFGRRPDALNTNHPWAGRDDVTELYFRDWAHLHKVFSSDYVKTDVAPDGLKFADIESSIALLVSEKSLTLRSPTVDRTPLEGSRTVAVLWLSALQGSGDPARLEELLSPKLISALEAHAAGEVWGLDANVAIESEGFDLKGYFGGSKTPDYALAYKISLKDHASVTSVRKAQATFFEDARDYLDLYDSFILFGIEGLIMDVANDKRFDPTLQPEMSDLPGKSHLEG